MTKAPQTKMPQTDLDKMLSSTTPEQLAGDPILRKAFIVGLMASEIFAPVTDSEEAQAQNGGVSLMATPVDGAQHVLLFSNMDAMVGFVPAGTRFAKMPGTDIFPLLMGNHAILNAGPSGLKLAPEDIAEINGKAADDCGSAGHVHGPNCSH